MGEKKKIFIGCATADIELSKIVLRILKKCEVYPLLWTNNNVFIPSRTTYNNLVDTAKEVDGAVFIFGNSDEVVGKHFVPRDNVLIEYGIFSSYLHYTKTLIVRFEGTKIASDLAGITYVDYVNNSQLENKINIWVNKNIIDSKYRTPFKEYLHVLNQNRNLKRKLQLQDEELIKVAIKHNINYKQCIDSIENELWKIVYMDDYFNDMISLIISKHSKEVLSEAFISCNFENHARYLNHSHLPLYRVIENIFKRLAIEIIENKTPYTKFSDLVEKFDHTIYGHIYDCIHEIEFYWTKENDKYNNIGG